MRPAEAGHASYQRSVKSSMKYATFAMLMLTTSTAVEAAAGNYIRLSAGGITTNGLEISIALNTGFVTKRSM
jgi:hypothetical protein